MKKAYKWPRLLILMGLLVYVTYEAYMHQVLGGGKAASVHALCPYGALESLYAVFYTGGFIQKIYSGTFILLALTVVLAILFRRSFCGLLCPFGALQEVFTLIRKKLLKKRFTVPEKIDKPLRYLKYVILLLTIVMAWRLGTLWMAPYDPYSAYSHITAFSDSIKEDPLAIVGFILLAVTIVGSFLYDRFFCKYLCPVGALYGIIGKFSPTKIVRDDDKCSHCNICNKACPANINVSRSNKITSAECISCNQCVAACPKKGALEVKTGKIAVHPLAMLGLVVVLFFGTMFIVQASGNFQVLPSALKEGEVIPVSDIKGYYTIEEAATATGLSLQELYEKLGIPESVAKTTKMKEISNIVPTFNFDEAKEKASDGEEPKATPADSTDSTKKVDVSGVRGSMTIKQASEALNMDLKNFYKLFKIPDSVASDTTMKNIANVSKGYDFEKVKEELK